MDEANPPAPAYVTKTRLSTETVFAVVNETPLAASRQLRAVLPLEDGLFNSAFRLDFADGFRAVLKVAPIEGAGTLRYEHRMMEGEVGVLRLIARNSSIPAPRVLHADFSRSAIPADFMIMEFLPGIPFNKVRDQWPQSAVDSVREESGRFLREVNSIGNIRFGYFALPESAAPSWFETFKRMIEWLLEDASSQSISLPVSPDTILQTIQRFRDDLDAVRSAQLVHWDLWDGNILVDPESRRITGIIDWERALWGDPLMETNFRWGVDNAAFARGYGTSGEPDTGAPRRLLLYDLHLALIWIIECYYRSFPTADQANQGRTLVTKTIRLLELEK